MMRAKFNKKRIIIAVVVCAILVVLLVNIVSLQIAKSNIRKLYSEIVDPKIVEFLNQVSSDEELESCKYAKKVGITDIEYEIIDISKEKDYGETYYVISLKIACQSEPTDSDDTVKYLAACDVEHCFGKFNDDIEIGNYHCRYYSVDRSSTFYCENLMTVYLNGELVDSPTPKNNKSSDSKTSTRKCSSCGKSYQAGDAGGNYMSIAKTSFCKNCYERFKQKQSTINEAVGRLGN